MILYIVRGTPVLDSLMFAVALAVAAIPGSVKLDSHNRPRHRYTKMAEQNAVIKDLKAVEGLGCVSVICSDKTGTLTQNKMTVRQVYLNGKEQNADASACNADSALLERAMASVQRCRLF